MKKLFKVIATICALVVVYYGVQFVTVEIQKKIIEDSINADRYTTEEYNKFQNELNDKTFYYYHNLPQELKDAYISLYFSAVNFDEKCKVRLTEEELITVVDAVVYDNSELFWLTGSYNYSVYTDYVEITHEYRLDENKAKKISKQIEKKIDEIVKNMPQYGTQFEKELYLHDYVCNNTVYDKNAENLERQTAYGALLSGKTVCEGYARAIQLLLDEVGIKNYLIVGDTSDNSDELHMWNVVQIDGYNYHLDATWNDGAFTNNEQGYFYFNVTDSYIKKTHSNFNVENNNCVYDMANYFQKNNTYIRAFTGFSNLINVTADTLKTGKNSIEFIFANSSDYNRALKEIKSNNLFFYYVDKSVGRSGRKLSTDKVTYSTVDEYNFLRITFEEVN